MFWFTSDEHYGHANIIKYSSRPFDSVEKMDLEIINRSNSVVKDNDVVIHCGDFTLHKSQFAERIIRQLKGTHIFITGSHDRWMDNVEHVINGIPISLPGYVYERKLEGTYIVACHYAMRVWPRSHYGSIQVYGHSHGNLPGVGRQLDVGVDSHDFYPVSLEYVIEATKNNLNLGETNGKETTSSRVQL